MERLEDLPNIGKVAVRQLIQVGIESPVENTGNR